MPPARDPARDLLFGLLALQTGLIHEAQLVAAFHAWTQGRDRTMATVLAEQGALQAHCQTLVEGLVLEHLRRHCSDPERSLAALGVGRSTREALAAIGDGELEASLARVGSGSTEREGDPDRTASYAVGAATSDGQRFRVLRPHARGGLGAVFVALDGELNREVALKQILDGHADDPESRRRFLLEAEVTGGLEHPGIVPVYGLGTYADGRPYYAMRLIKGDSLKEAIANFHADEALRRHPGQRSLELRRLLRRFLDVCNAIEFAHSCGVLHRDLKPSNVILGKHGETLVVDWGLAKALGRADSGTGGDERQLLPSSASGSAETLPGSALGTPAFMSPEQAAGELDRLGPRSDVYSLGATLYCLLTGSPPFAGEVGDVLRAVPKGDFRPPRSLDPRIEPALEAVCLKAMALKPEVRYCSARALAEDVERWLADEPVLAFPDSPPRRLVRWASRHRLVVRTVVIASLLVSISYVVSNYVILRRETQALQEAKRALDSSDRMRWNLADRVRKQHQLIEASSILQSQVAWLSRHAEKQADRADYTRFREAFLRQQIPYFINFIKYNIDDPALKDWIAKAHCQLGLLHAELGEKGEALASYKSALEIWKDTYSQYDGRVWEFSDDYTLLYVNIGGIQKEIGQWYQAAQSYELAIATLKNYNTPCGTMMSLYRDAGDLLKKTGKPTEALRNYDQAMQTLESKPECARLADTPAYLYDKACLLALCSDAIAQGAVSQDGRNQSMCANQSMTALREAVDAGYKDLDHMMNDADLNLLRSREDFKELLRYFISIKASRN